MNLLQKEDIRFFRSRIKNYLRSFFKDSVALFHKIFSRRKLPYSDTFIKRLYFEVANSCNLQCCFCLYSKKPLYRRGIMSFSIFRKAIDDFARTNGSIVSFTPTIGEPLLDPNLIEKIRYAVSLPSIKKVYFYTNGTLLSQNDNYKKLIDSGIHNIEISIAGFDEEIFKQVHQVDLYKQTLAGIIKLLQYNNEKNEPVGIRINFRSPVLPSRVLGSKDFRTYIKPFLSEKVSYSFMPDYDNWGGAIKQEDLKGIMKLRRAPKIKYLPCKRTYDVAILFDGSVRLCACRFRDTEFDELVVGNINNDSLKNIFYSEKARAIRKSFLYGNTPSACKHCSFYESLTK